MKKSFVLLVILAVLGLYASFINAKLKFGSDSVDYYRLGQSIGAGRGYTIDGRFNTKWPPVTPALLMVGMVAFHAGVAGEKILLGTVALTGLLFAWLLLRRRDQTQLSTWVILLTAVTFPFIYWVLDFSSEGPYFFFTMAGLLCGEYAFAEPRKFRWALLAGVGIGLAALTRTVGFSMLVGFGLYGLIVFSREKSKAIRPVLLIALPALLLAGGWFLYAKHQGGETSVGAYGKYGFRPDTYDPNGKAGVGTALSRMKENAVGYAFIFSVPDASNRMKGMTHLNPRGLFSLTLMGLFVIGFLCHLVRRPQFAECYLLVYGGVLMVFNWYDIRYMVPILPLILYYFAWTTARLITWAAERIGKPKWNVCATTVVLVLLILVNTGVSIASQPAKRLRSLQYDGSAGELHDATMWIKERDPQAVIMCRSAAMTWFWTHMKTEGIPLIGNPEEMWQHMLDLKVTIVIDDVDDFSGVTGKFLDPALNAHKDKLEQIAAFGQTRVLQIHP